LPLKIKLRPRTVIFIHDVLMAPIAWMGGYWLRFNLETIPEPELGTALLFMPWVVAVQACSYWFFGLYRGVWRFSSMPDVVRIAKAIVAAIVIIAVGMFFFNRLQGVPRSQVPLYTGLLLALLCTPRFLYRFWKDTVLKQRSGKRALIVGAGAAGEMLARDLAQDCNSGYLPVAFADDDGGKRKREIRGLSVAGNIAMLPELIETLHIEVLLIAIPSATDAQMRRIIEVCENCSVPFQTLPSVKELLSGNISRSNLRDVSIEDILGREAIHLDWASIRNALAGRNILVTGGGGSIGSELCIQLAKVKPGRLVVFDQCEFNLYKIDAELRKLYPSLQFDVILGDVTDAAAIQRLFQTTPLDAVFHAAAYKHVPLLENQVREAVRNNLIGTRTVAEAAMAANIGRFVLISTDKAVNPTNVMGATKRAAEILCQNLNDPAGTHFTTVRFGNVLDSAGSVVPLFREQIKAGGPVTVTHPDICRYFMTIPEACQLIMQAETVGKGGEVFVLDMGEPIKIAYLAEQMIILSGKRPGKDISIEYVGLRPGEKLYEELFHEHEPLMPTGYEKLLLAKARSYDKAVWAHQVDALAQACGRQDEDEIVALLQTLVPEFVRLTEA
jgi:FlaA1/EpsC-like NDP-sugar epimerase